MKLINARYKLTEEEIDFLIVVIEHIKDNIISFNSKKYNLKFIKKVVSKTLEIATNDGYYFINWFTKIELNTTTSRVNITLQDDVKSFLINLSEDLSSNDLKFFFLLSSNYSRAIYKMLKMHQYKSKAVINLEELKEKLQVPKALQLYSNFKIKVLIIAQEELKENTDISFTLEEKKDGKKVTSLIFIINTQEILVNKISEKPQIIQKKEKLETEITLVQSTKNYLDKSISPLNQEIKRIVNLFDQERKKIQPNFIRKEAKYTDGEYLLREHLKETKRTPAMFFDAIRWLFSNNPKASFHRQYIMNIAKLIEHFNTLEHQAMYSEEAIKFNEEAQSWYNIYKKQGLKEEEILEKLKEGGFIK